MKNIKLTLILSVLAAAGLPFTSLLGLLSLPTAATGSSLAATLALFAATQIFKGAARALRKALMVCAAVAIALVILMIML